MEKMAQEELSYLSKLHYLVIWDENGLFEMAILVKSQRQKENFQRELTSEAQLAKYHLWELIDEGRRWRWTGREEGTATEKAHRFRKSLGNLCSPMKEAEPSL